MIAATDILSEIYAQRRETLAREEALEPREVLERRADAQATGRRSFRDAIIRADRIGIIGEIKFASPSRGTIVDSRDPVPIARRLADAGIDALSIVTEPHFFRGNIAALPAVRKRTTLPLLRKDFLTSTYEIAQSVAYGADAVLLIVAGLSDEQLRALLLESKRWNLDVLLEVHNEFELQRALALEPSMIGINNRDLRTFEVRLATSVELLRSFPRRVLSISESGITSPEDVGAFARHGARGCLIGEALLHATDPQTFVSACRSAAAQ